MRLVRLVGLNQFLDQLNRINGGLIKPNLGEIQSEAVFQKHNDLYCVDRFQSSSQDQGLSIVEGFEIALLLQKSSNKISYFLLIIHWPLSPGEYVFEKMK